MSFELCAGTCVHCARCQGGTGAGGLRHGHQPQGAHALLCLRGWWAEQCLRAPGGQAPRSPASSERSRASHTLWSQPLEKHLFASFVFGPTRARLPRSPREGQRGFRKGDYMETGFCRQAAWEKPGRCRPLCSRARRCCWGSEPPSLWGRPSCAGSEQTGPVTG